ncbi:hypothetical protein DFAR_630014 [Desulfarculales bacterium]
MPASFWPLAWGCNRSGDWYKQPHEIFLEITADREAEYPCPECGRLCKVHDFY